MKKTGRTESSKNASARRLSNLQMVRSLSSFSTPPSRPFLSLPRVALGIAASEGLSAERTSLRWWVVTVVSSTVVPSLKRTILESADPDASIL